MLSEVSITGYQII